MEHLDLAKNPANAAAVARYYQRNREQRLQDRREYYEKNREKLRAEAREYQKSDHAKALKAESIASKVAWVSDLKVAVGCIECGYKAHAVALHFDHVRGSKRHNVAQMVRSNLSLESIQREIDKCEVRCANCHAIRHFGSE